VQSRDHRSLGCQTEAPVDLAQAAARFHAEHERAYNYRRDASPIEIYRLSVRAVGVTPKPQLPRHERNGGGAAAPRASRPVHFDASGDAFDTPLYVRSDLPAGIELDGPAIIDQLDSTTLVPPGWRAEVDEWLNIRMHREESA
jgi:N-methylhydantoinase A